jgi:hypothetical protein
MSPKTTASEIPAPKTTASGIPAPKTTASGIPAQKNSALKRPATPAKSDYPLPTWVTPTSIVVVIFLVIFKFKACVRACVRACMRACVRACVHACMHAMHFFSEHCYFMRYSIALFFCRFCVWSSLATLDFNVNLETKCRYLLHHLHHH